MEIIKAQKNPLVLDKNVLVAGMGTSGCRAAQYILKLGAITGLHIAGFDSDSAALEQLIGINTVLLPEIKTANDSSSEDEEQEPEGVDSTLRDALDAQFPTIKLLLLIGGLGGKTSSHYLLQALNYAKEKKMPVATIVAMPHCFDKPNQHDRAAKTLQELQRVTEALQVLHCTELGILFQDQTKELAYQQAMRWLAESCLGFLRPFVKASQSKVNTETSKTKEESTQLTLEFDDQPRGIFSGMEPTKYYGENLDVPTYQRKKISVDKGS